MDWQPRINMRIPRLFVNQSLHAGSQVELAQDKAHHIAHVLRMRIGDSVRLFNDGDEEFDAVLVDLKKKSAVINIEKCTQVKRESPLKIILAIGISRGQHMDYAIQKAVELGVTEIVPVLTEFGNVKIYADRKDNKLSHWQNIIINASEQCGRTSLTRLSEPISYSKFLSINKTATRLIFHPGNSQTIESVKIIDNNVILLIGPEGGFSDKEIEMADENGYIKVSLGPRVLRAETAVVAALSVCQHRWGDLN